MTNQDVDTRLDGASATLVSGSASTLPFGRFKGPAAWLVALLLVATAVAWRLDIHIRWEPPYLNVVLQVAVVGITGLIIAALAERSFMSSGSWPVLWLGAGALTFSLADSLSTILLQWVGANAAVTTYSLAAFVAATFHLLGALFVANGLARLESNTGQRVAARQVYFGALAAVILITVGAATGQLPPFFVQGQGGMPWRQMAVALAGLLFALAGITFLGHYRRSRADFVYWYGMALLLNALVMLGTLLTTTTGSPMSWLVRLALLLSGVYMVVATLVTLSQARARNVPPTQVLAGFFWHDEASLRRLFESIMDAIIVTDQHFVITEWNQAAQAVYGWQAEEVIGKRVADVLRTAYRSDAERERGHDALSHAETWRGEVWQCHRDGRMIPILATVSALKDTQGNVVGAVAVNRDITERKRVEEQLRASEEQTRDLIRYAPTGIYEVDYRTGRFRSVNDATCAILGYTRDQLLAMTAFDLLDDAGKVRFADRIRRTLAGEPIDPSVEYRIFKQDGTALYAVLNTRFTYHDGQPDGAFVIAHDVTERRRVAEELREAAETLEKRVQDRTAELALQTQRLAILHEIERAILSARAPADIAQIAVERLQQAVGAQRATVVSFDTATRTVEILGEAGLIARDFRASEHVPMAQYPMIERVQAGQVATIEDFAALPDSWSPKEATLQAGIRSATLVPLTIGSQVIGALTISLSTPGKLASEALELALQAADSLAVALYNAQLAQQIELSREEMKNLSHHLVELQENERSLVANELYNDEGQRLAALMLELGLAAKEAEGKESLEARVARARDMAGGILFDMHALAVTLRPASLDRLGLIPALRQYAEELGRQNGLTVQVEVLGHEKVPLAPNTETMIYRVAQEAVTNAMRHSTAGQIGIMASQRDDRLVLVVDDDGVGFDVAEAIRCGGLGIVGMRERTEMLGGKLTIESGPGKGTAVYIEVPIERQPAGS